MRLVSASPELAPAARVTTLRGSSAAAAVSPSSTEGVDRRRLHVTWFGVGTVTLVLATVISRVLFMTRTLYAFDSANYALGVRDFYNVAFHQPHPPGYPLYVFFARAIQPVVQDANRALILEGIVWSAVAVACTTLLGRRLFGRTVGLLSGLLLFATVGFWGYGEVAYPYVALAGETAALALLTHHVLSGNPRSIVALGAVWAVSLGVRWDAAVFCLPLALWALLAVSWRLRISSVALAAAIVVAFAIPMVALTGGWDVYRQAMADYLRAWSPQSAYVVGDFASGGDTQAGYNLNFLVNYLRQMLGVGLILILYLFGRRFAPSVLAGDYRSRFLALWVTPPLLVYVFVHLGEPGYVLSLAPQAALLIALSITDLRDEMVRLAQLVRARRWSWTPAPRTIGVTTAIVLTVAIVGWNVQAFARGVGPGRLPDLRAHDATTQAQVDFIRQQDARTTFVLSHDIFRQLHYYVPEYRGDLLFSEYVPEFRTALTRTDLPSGTQQVVVLDSPLKVAQDDAGQTREVVLSGQPRVSVWLVNAAGAKAVEHGYQFVRLIR
jgi:dolichyl-phosphate-mannose-protein mannosyltransferase